MARLAETPLHEAVRPRELLQNCRVLWVCSLGEGNDQRARSYTETSRSNFNKYARLHAAILEGAVG